MNPNDLPHFLNNLANQAMNQQHERTEEFHQSLAVLDELSERNIRIFMRMLFKYPNAATQMLQFVHTFAVEGYRLQFEAVGEKPDKPLRNSEGDKETKKEETTQ